MISIVTVNPCNFNKSVGQNSTITFKATGVPDPSHVTTTLGSTNASAFAVASTTASSTADWYNAVITCTSSVSGDVQISITVSSGDQTSSACFVPNDAM